MICQLNLIITKMSDFIYIPLNVPSLKNSKQLFENKKTGRKFITSSNYCKKYKKNTGIYYNAYRKRFLKMIEGKEPPYIIEFTFIRDKKQKWDFQNIVQMPLDMMQEYRWIPDDDINTVLPIPPLPPKVSHRYEKGNGGMEIRVL